MSDKKIKIEDGGPAVNRDYDIKWDADLFINMVQDDLQERHWIESRCELLQTIAWQLECIAKEVKEYISRKDDEAEEESGLVVEAGASTAVTVECYHCHRQYKLVGGYSAYKGHEEVYICEQCLKPLHNPLKGDLHFVLPTT